MIVENIIFDPGQSMLILETRLIIVDYPHSYAESGSNLSIGPGGKQVGPRFARQHVPSPIPHSKESRVHRSPLFSLNIPGLK